MIALAAWAIVKRFWPVAAAIAVALALWAWGSYRETEGWNAGVDKERAAWVAGQAKAASLAATLARQRDDAVARADAAGILAGRALAALAASTRTEVTRYYETNPGANRACLDAGRLRSIADGDRAALAAAVTPGGGDGAVRDSGADRRR